MTHDYLIDEDDGDVRSQPKLNFIDISTVSSILGLVRFLHHYFLHRTF